MKEGVLRALLAVKDLVKLPFGVGVLDTQTAL
jgi:hypothetical protein